MKRVLVISPHPDDESIGCGGTLRKHVVEGDEVHVVFLTSGEAGGHGVVDAGRVREDEARRAAGILGVADFEFWREVDGRVRSTGGLSERLRGKFRDLRPDVVYFPHGADFHPDHRAAARVVRRALWNGGRATVADALMFEVWTPLSRIDVVVDVTPFMAAKLGAIRAYKSQCDIMRFDEAMLGLSRYRGELFNWHGGDFAEIFARARL